MIPVAEPQIIIRVRGNCGIEHSSVEEWRQCRLCDRAVRMAEDRWWLKHPWARPISQD